MFPKSVPAAVSSPVPDMEEVLDTNASGRHPCQKETHLLLVCAEQVSPGTYYRSWLTEAKGGSQSVLSQYVSKESC